MNFNIILGFLSLIIEAVSLIVISQKTNKTKADKYFYCFSFIVFLLTPFTKLISKYLYYLILILHPFFFYLYFLFYKKYQKYLSIFYSLFLIQAVAGSETFFSVIISSVTGDDFVHKNWTFFYIVVDSLALFVMLKILNIFNIDFHYLENKKFRENINKVTFALSLSYVLLRFSDFIASLPHFNSFASMVTTISFLVFLYTLFYFKAVQEKDEKERQIKQKEKEQLQLQKYTDEINNLYNEIRSFRHDYAGMLTSLQTSINTRNIKEVEQIFQNVLVKANLQLRSEKYTYFELNNIGDSALRSVLIETLFKAEEFNIRLTFEVKDYIDRLPMKLLDLVRLASILLNNAVEAAKESYEKEIHISLILLDTEIVFVVKNSRKKRELDLEEIYQLGFSTKGHERGLGLNNAKKIINGYDDIVLDTEIHPTNFVQVVTMRREEMS